MPPCGCVLRGPCTATTPTRQFGDFRLGCGVSGHLGAVHEMDERPSSQLRGQWKRSTGLQYPDSRRCTILWPWPEADSKPVTPQKARPAPTISLCSVRRSRHISWITFVFFRFYCLLIPLFYLPFLFQTLMYNFFFFFLNIAIYPRCNQSAYRRL